MWRAQGVKTVFEKQVKGNVFELEGDKCQLQLPADDKKDMHLTMGILVIQGMVNSTFSLQLRVRERCCGWRLIREMAGRWYWPCRAASLPTLTVCSGGWLPRTMWPESSILGWPACWRLASMAPGLTWLMTVARPSQWLIGSVAKACHWPS